MSDTAFMRRALFHAGRAEGVTTPNPMVGAVIVSPDGVVVGQGRHPRAGEPHAEVFALDDARERARGATMYVTLEPCCHTGRTGPCTKRIIAAGITRVVAILEQITCAPAAKHSGNEEADQWPRQPLGEAILDPQVAEACWRNDGHRHTSKARRKSRPAILSAFEAALLSQ